MSGQHSLVAFMIYVSACASTPLRAPANEPNAQPAAATETRQAAVPQMPAEQTGSASLPTALLKVRVDTLALARADWTQVDIFAAAVIADLRNILLASGNASQKTLDELQFQIMRLERGRQSGFNSAGWIKEALVAAIGGLERSGAFVHDARDAIENIDDRANIAFERAEIQDAVRATMAAFIRSFGDDCASTPSTAAF